jgi:single-strand DNA-binding protein
MSEGLNRATLLGNLGADPEMNFTQGGTAAMRLRLATTTVYFDKDKKKQERTEWHRVTVWGSRAEGLAKILTKGSRIYVEGEFRTSEYEKDGVKKYSTEIHASTVLPCGDAPSGGGRRDEDRDDRRSPPPQRGRNDERQAPDDRRRDDRRDQRGREDDRTGHPY